MAHTAHTDPEMMRERYDSPESLEKKLDHLARLVSNSKHCVIFTGAGISTDAGIPDFRGPDGVWTLKAQGKRRKKKTVDTLCALPTATHMSIVELQKRGIVKYLISQNCDGLHRRSGIEPSRISELHGNGNIEHCEDCGYEYLRDFHCYRVSRGSDHYTGRHCVVPLKTAKGKTRACNGRLLDSTIDFGQSLPERPLRLAYDNSEAADLHIVLGSSLTVSPACDMPKTTAKRGGDLVICNLQKTPLEKYATSHIYARCNTIMEGLMARLDIPIPQWKLNRIVKVGVSHTKGKYNLSLQGFERGTKGQAIPASILSKAEVLVPFAGSKGYVLAKEPLRLCRKLPEDSEADCIAIVRLFFMGHYDEPCLDLKVDLRDARDSFLVLRYNPSVGEWEVHRNIKLNCKNSDSVFSDILNGKTSVDSAPGFVEECDWVPMVDEDCSIPLEETDPKYKSLFGSLEIKAKTFEVRAETSPQTALWGTAVLAPSDDSLYTFGGAGKKLGINKFTLETGQWESVTHVSNKRDGGAPFVENERWGHSSAVFADQPNMVYLFGGWDSKAQYNDVHIFNTKTSKLAKINTPPSGGNVPSCRAGHSTTVVNHEFCVLFGGAECSGGHYNFFNDMYAFNKNTRKWKKLTLPASHGTPPSPRAQHASVMVDHRTMAIVGGYDGKHLLNDIHLFDLVDMKWRDLALPTGDVPPLRSIAPVGDYRVYPAKSTAVVLKPALTSEGRGKDSSMHNPHLAYLCQDGLYILNLYEWHWTNLGSEVPLARTCHSAVPMNDSSMIVFGGLLAASKEKTTKVRVIQLQIDVV